MEKLAHTLLKGFGILLGAVVLTELSFACYHLVKLFL